MLLKSLLVSFCSPLVIAVGSYFILYLMFTLVKALRGKWKDS